MANEIKIPVSILDNTDAGLASIEAKAKAAGSKVAAGSGDTYALGGGAADTYGLAPDPAAQAAVVKLREEVDRFNETLKRGAEYADRMSEELQTMDFPEGEIDSMRLLYSEIEKTRHATRLAADTFEQLGQTDAAAQLRIGLTETRTSATRLKTALDQLNVNKLATEMHAAGNAAQATAVDVNKAAREATLAASGFNRLQQAATTAAGRRGASGQGVLQLAYAVDDMQYGLRGVVNNIPMLLTGLGAGAGLAGVVSMLAIGLNMLGPHLGTLAERMKEPGKVAADTAKEAQHWYDQLEASILRVKIGSEIGSNERAKENLANLEAEFRAREKLAAQKAAEKAIGEGMNANALKEGERKAKAAMAELDTVEELTQAIKSQEQYLDVQGRAKFWGAEPQSAEDLAKATEKLGDLKAKLDEVTKANEQKAKAQQDADAEAAYSRSLEFYSSEIKTLDQIRDRLEQIDTLKKGKSTGVAGAYDLDEKSAKRLHDEEQKLLNLEVQLLKATRERMKETDKVTADALEKLKDQTAELTKQQQVENALHEIEKKRAAVTTGADDPNAEAARLKQQASRDLFLDGVRQKTEQLKQLADQAANDDTLTDQQKAARRDDYAKAVQDQITQEADAKQVALQEQIRLDIERSQKLASLDEEALKIREQASRDAEAEFLRATEAKREADKQQNEDIRKRANEERAKAEAELLRANAELGRQMATNERNKNDLAEKNRQQHTRQRIADEIAIGKAREKALLDAAQLEKEIEDAKNAARQAVLQQQPQVQQAARQIAGRIKPKEIQRKAMERRQNAAAQKFIAEQRARGKKAKAGDVKAVRAKAGAQFQKDLKRGAAEGELAAVGNEMFAKMVDQTRGLAKPVADALKAIATKAANDLQAAAEVRGDVEAIEKAKPGDKAAAKRAEVEAKTEKQRQERANRPKPQLPPKEPELTPEEQAEENQKSATAAANRAKAEAKFQQANQPQPAAPPVATQPVAQPVAPAVDQAVGAMEAGANAVASTDGQIIQGFTSIAAALTDLRNRQIKTQDVLSQTIAHINSEGANFAAQDEAATLRGTRAVG